MSLSSSYISLYELQFSSIAYYLSIHDVYKMFNLMFGNNSF